MMGDMGIMMVGWCVLGLGLLAALVVALVYAILRGERGRRSVSPPRDEALEVVRRRYAAGDIDEDEYLERPTFIGRN